jgi:hypothetical protein
VLGQTPKAGLRLGGGGGEEKGGGAAAPSAAAAAADDDLRYAIVGDDHDGDDGRTLNSIVLDTLHEDTPHDDDDEKEAEDVHKALEKKETAAHPPTHTPSSSAARGPRPSSPLMTMLVASVAGITATGGATTRTATSLSLAAFVSTLVLAAMPTADAHNWVPTPGRNWGGASTTTPCKGRKVTDTHQQVGPGQTFNMGFQTGHGSKHYLIVLHGDDEHWLAHPKLLE